MPQSLHNCSTWVLSAASQHSPQSVWRLQDTGWAHHVQLLLHCANSWCPPLNSAYLQAIAHKHVWLWPGNMAGLPGGSLSWSHTSALPSLTSKFWTEGQWQNCAYSCWGGRCSLGSVSDNAMLVSSLQRGYKLVVRDHPGRSADYNELLNSF